MELKLVRYYDNVRMGKVLTTPAKPVTKLTPEIVELVEGMFDVMYKFDGIGLAAPQVGLGLKIIVLDITNIEGYEDSEYSRLAIINPKIIWASTEEEIEKEGCLSFPGLYIPVKRSKEIIVGGMGIDGKELRIKLSGFPARVVLHETDHTNGVVFIDRVYSSLLDETQREEIKKIYKILRDGKE